MSDRQETAEQPAIVQAVLRLPPAEQQLLLEWSRGLGAIRDGTLHGGRKALAMLVLTRDCKATWPLMKVMTRALKNVIWDARSWTVRLGLGSIIAIFIAIGNTATGIVALGNGIGLPLWMLIGTGGALMGMLADRIKKHMRSPRRD